MAKKDSDHHLAIDMGIVVGGVIVLLLAAGGFLYFGKATDNPGVWFVTLMLVVLAAMAATGAVFTGLRLASGKEAFGLPSGSIRALLAVGIMALLVVFGLHFSDPSLIPTGDMPANPVKTVTVPVEDIDQTVRLYRDQDFKVIVQKDKANPTGPATIDLYPATDNRTAYIGEMGKQLVTAIITLLTSVVGFYFGSRSATDSSKNATKTLPASIPGDMTVTRKTLEDDFTAATGPTADQEAELARIKALPALEVPEEETQRQQFQKQADAAARPVSDTRTAFQAALAAADAAITLLGQTPVDAARPVEAKARDALADARAKLDAFSAAAAAFDEQMVPLLQATAEG